MARSTSVTVEKNFVNGLVTEATALNFPEAAATDTQNCQYNVDGSFNRRLGIDYESNYDTLTLARDGLAVKTFYWANASGNGDNNIVVVQLGMTLYFYVLGSASLSLGRITGSTVDLSTYLASGSPATPEQYPCEFAYGKGYLFVTHQNMEPIYVSYNASANTVTATAITIQVRDLKGLTESVTNDNRPSSLTDTHKYNLYNQGWAPYGTGGKNDPRPTGVTVPSLPTSYLAGDPLSTWDSNRSDFPSNSDVWWLLKDANEAFQPVQASGIIRGNSPAAKGHYILSAFSKDRSTAVAMTVNTGSGNVSVAVAGLATETCSYYRPKAVSFFAGRVWYAGVDYDGFNNTLYFSQIIREGEVSFGKCYQENDPTSEYSFDTLATDGGTIQILDCGSIIKLFSLASNLVIFATNGIWTVSGSVGTGFTPTDFSVQKISSSPALSASSFVDIAGMPAWWTADGIYIITAGNQGGGVTVTSLTEKKIKRFFIDDILAESKRYAKGMYNPLTKVVQWIYRSTAATSVSERYEYDSILCFNTVTQAFYPWTVPHPSVTINGITVVVGNVSTTTTVGVVDDAAAVVTDSTPTAISVYAGSDDESPGLFKYLISKDNGATSGITFAEEYDERLLDFYSIDSIGTDYESYTISGYRVRGDAQKKFQSNYVVLFMDTTADNQFNFSSIWDYATSSTTGDYGTVQTVDTTTVTGRKYKFRRLKIRGMGISLQFKIQSITGQPFKIAGWSTFDTGNTVV